MNQVTTTENTKDLTSNILLYIICFLQINAENIRKTTKIKNKLEHIKKLILLFDLYCASNPYNGSIIIKHILNKSKNFVLRNFYLLNKSYNLKRKTNKVKNKSLVSSSTRKLWKQKGTGRARIGSRKSPLLRGGGVVFGPLGQTSKIKINKKLKKRLFYSTFINKIKSLILLEHIDLKKFANKDKKNTVKYLLAFHPVKFKDNKNILKYSNYKNVQVKPLNMINTYDLLKNNYFIIQREDLFPLLTRLIN